MRKIYHHCQTTPSQSGECGGKQIPVKSTAEDTARTKEEEVTTTTTAEEAAKASIEGEHKEKL